MKTTSLFSLSLILTAILTSGTACLADDSNSGIGSDFDMTSMQAQNYINGGNTGAAQGQAGYQTFRTNEAPAQRTYGNSAPTGTQVAALGIPTTTYTSLDAVYGRGQALPATTMDSFVYNSAGAADQIYGDEGSTSIPPLMNFETIGDGIYQGGLTTGHASALPSAWGYPN